MNKELYHLREFAETLPKNKSITDPDIAHERLEILLKAFPNQTTKKNSGILTPDDFVDKGFFPK